MTSATVRFFDAIARRYDRVYARPTDERRERSRRLLEVLGRPRDVLDLGVGTGAELPALLDAGHRVTGVDVSPAMLALCNERSRKIPCILADFWEGLPAEQNTFDAVIALFGTLAHAPSSAAYAPFAREVLRVLRPGGIFFAEVPTSAWAAEHPMFEDDASGERVPIVAPRAEEWRAAFSGFEVTVIEEGAELTLIAKRS